MSAKKKFCISYASIFFLIFGFFFFCGYNPDYGNLWYYLKTGILRCFFLPLTCFPLSLDTIKSFLILFAIIFGGILFPLLLSLGKPRIFPYCIFFVIFTFFYFWLCLLWYSVYDEKFDREKAKAEKIYTGDDDEFTVREYESIKKAGEIIAALEEFHNDNGFYPRELNQLIPKYLKRIPKTNVYYRYDLPLITHAEFIYRLDNCNGWRDIEKEDGSIESEHFKLDELYDSEIQNYYLHFRYNFDEDYYYFASSKKWEYDYH